MTLLAVNRLCKTFRGLRAIDDVSFDIAQGSITSIVGPNGAGKSTLFNMISGYLKPTAGDAQLAGERITGMPPYVIAGRGIARAHEALPRGRGTGATGEDHRQCEEGDDALQGH